MFKKNLPKLLGIKNCIPTYNIVKKYHVLGSRISFIGYWRKIDISNWAHIVLRYNCSWNSREVVGVRKSDVGRMRGPAPPCPGRAWPYFQLESRRVLYSEFECVINFNTSSNDNITYNIINNINQSFFYHWRNCITSLQ